MRNRISSSFLLYSLAMLGEAVAQDDRHQWSIEIELDVRTVDDSSKLAAASDSRFARVAFVYAGAIKPTLSVNAVIDAVDDGTSGVDITEAYLAWKPVPRSPFRHGVRAGAFYPPLSLENVGTAWTSPYSRSFSAINSWIGEELRTLGAEWNVSRALGPRSRQRELRFMAAAYYGNDPAGALLAWRGFALHERQSRLGDAITLPAVPQIQPGMMFEAQAPATEPFVETDHSPGFYYGAEWKLGRRVLLTALHYDNHADPLTLKDGHYGWTTRFDHVGAKLELPAGLGLIVQWMDGTTVMGPPIPPAPDGYHVVDAHFDSAFALLTKAHDRHRWSVRFDDFSIVDHDQIPLDDNSESGRALTAAWRYETDRGWSVGLEWVSLDVDRPAFAYFGRPESETENLVRFELRYRLWSDPARR
jgi:hypothetical protein